MLAYMLASLEMLQKCVSCCNAGVVMQSLIVCQFVPCLLQVVVVVEAMVAAVAAAVVAAAVAVVAVMGLMVAAVAVQ